ncbi:unnamed protein product [Arabis nemorensis]|uniref:Uncharacterized protein n=1 Tax=Arabis nemorensis TaxID=586526 RepID=A0A565AXH9_9BRAS|nr:unnamed protein product [Arabis nemorensis]
MASEAMRIMLVLDPNRENGALWLSSLNLCAMFYCMFEIDNAPRRVIVAAIKRHFDGPWSRMKPSSSGGVNSL